MPTFEVYDTVVVKTDPTLIGTVERTHSLAEGYDSLEEHLILRHVPVPEHALTDFVTSGVPPRGFVFITSLDEERGSFLASENDLILLCRSFDLGDIVKRPDGVTGTIVDVIDTYTIQPLWLLDNGVKLASTLPKNHLRDCDSAVPDQCPHAIISHVPGQELTHKQTLFEDDLICYKEWLGVVSDLDVDVIVQFEDDSIVVLDSPDDLHMPVPEPGKPLVSLPELTNEHIKRPDLPSAFQGYSWVIPTRYPRPGTFVVASRKTLRTGRWVRGKYSSTGATGGVVLDLVPRQMVAQWLSCNPFAPLKSRQVVHPYVEQNVYANHSSYRSSATLRPNPNLQVIDLSSPPRSETLRSDTSDAQTSSLSHEVKPASLHQDLKVGDCVRFRDPSAAAVKYQGLEDTFSGRFNRISEDLTHGWDLNIFKVIAKNQNVQVLWQDGTTVPHNANEVQRFGGFEPDFAPTDVVVHRTGLKQMRDGSATQQDFNEMSFFESPHSLYPEKVGVIQFVDARERIAKVRWFQDPRITLLENGNRLRAESRLGPISDKIEEVSLYEVMTFPAFDRRLRDVALILPRKPSKRALEIIYSTEEIQANRQHASITPLLPPLQILASVRDIVRRRGFMKPEGAAEEGIPESIDSGVDWLGEIINTGLDGSVTVRLSGATPCRDIQVSFDEILAVIHLDYLGTDGEYSDQSMDDEEFSDEYLEGSETMSVTYEGGERIDNDSGDDNWESAEEEDQKEKRSLSQGAGAPSSDDSMPDASWDTPPPLTTTSSPHSKTKDAEPPSFVTLNSKLPSSAPPPFEILSISPPADQYQPTASLDPPTATTFLKRIRHEHKVLASSLPQGQIYVRTYDSRLDLLRCLIIGPTDTPYEYAPFLVDLYLSPDFPHVPPTAHFHSWTSGLGRINPNLYEEGKICLSLLGTWPGKGAGEGWSKNATILQVLISLQGLVMVPKPFYNEAGFENEEAAGGYANESATYSERAFVMARGFVGFALTRPPVGIEDVLAWLYLPSRDDTAELEPAEDLERQGLLRIVIGNGEKLIEASELARLASSTAIQAGQTAEVVEMMDGRGEVAGPIKGFLKPLSKGAMVMLRRQLEELRGCLNRWWDSQTGRRKEPALEEEEHG